MVTWSLLWQLLTKMNVLVELKTLAKFRINRLLSYWDRPPPLYFECTGWLSQALIYLSIPNANEIFTLHYINGNGEIFFWCHWFLLEMPHSAGRISPSLPHWLRAQKADIWQGRLKRVTKQKWTKKAENNDWLGNLLKCRNRGGKLLAGNRLLLNGAVVSWLTSVRVLFPSDVLSKESFCASWSLASLYSLIRRNVVSSSQVLIFLIFFYMKGSYRLIACFQKWM